MCEFDMYRALAPVTLDDDFKTVLESLSRGAAFLSPSAAEVESLELLSAIGFVLWVHSGDRGRYRIAPSGRYWLHNARTLRDIADEEASESALAEDDPGVSDRREGVA